MKSNRKHFVDKKLIFKLKMFAVIFTLMLLVISYELYESYIVFWKALVSIVGGICIGFLIGRASNVIWHEETNKAIVKMDVIGAIILILYIAFAIMRKSIFSYWFSGHELSAVVLCLSAGIMLGRLFSIRKQVIDVLKKQGKLD